MLFVKRDFQRFQSVSSDEIQMVMVEINEEEFGVELEQIVMKSLKLVVV